MPKRTQPAAKTKASHPTPEPLLTVSPRWLFTALALTLLLAALAAYATLCLLFYQGQWQLLYHPSRATPLTPASAGMAFQDIRFDVTDTGQPRLDGWWIPAQPGKKEADSKNSASQQPASQYVTATVLYLHGAAGSLSGAVPALLTLHSTGINVFAFDYRGFGHSTGAHPTERLATADSIAAFTYLTDTRHIPPARIIVFGDGVGAAFAAHLAAQFAPAGVILEDPNPPARQLLLADPRARLVPLWLLQKEKLDPAADLAASHVPRLFLDVQGDSARTYALFNISSYPKQYFDLRTLPATGPNSALSSTLTRFFDDVLH